MQFTMKDINTPLHTHGMFEITSSTVKSMPRVFTGLMLCITYHNICYEYARCNVIILYYKQIDEDKTKCFDIMPR